MAIEIAEQPEMLRRLSPAWEDSAQSCLEQLDEPLNLILIGRGSSGNACTFASYLYSLAKGRLPIEFRPWVATQTGIPRTSWNDCWAWAFSNSGESTDVAHSAQWLRERGAKVLGVTNAESPRCKLAESSDRLFRLGIGDERAIPATKSFNAQLFAAAALCGCPLQRAADEVSAAMEEILAGDQSKQLADFIAPARSIWWIARGPALGAALDAALKVQETAALLSMAYSTAESLHGPVGATSPKDRVVLFDDGPENATSLQAVRTGLLSRGAPVCRVVGGPQPRWGEEPSIEIPMPTERWARTPVLAFLAQLTALELAERRGLNPDLPPGLHKVTLT
jgi:glucosamine--fructose-6-phosphate aminotransferase (isomerizing)